MPEITNAIAKHICTKLGLFETTKFSICHSSFLTDKSISYEEDKKEKHSAVYACQTLIEDKKFSFINTSISSKEEDGDIIEHFLLIRLEGVSSYGIYLKVISDLVDSFIATEIKSKSWIPATVYLQGTLLAGMEQLADLAFQYNRADNVDELFQMQKEFIEYRENL